MHRFFDLVGDPIHSGLHICLPSAKARPSKLLELAINSSISGAVRFDLADPVASVMSRRELRSPLLPVSAMPEIAVAEYRHARPQEDQIRFPRQRTVMEAVP